MQHVFFQKLPEVLPEGGVFLVPLGQGQWTPEEIIVTQTRDASFP